MINSLFAWLLGIGTAFLILLLEHFLLEPFRSRRTLKEKVRSCLRSLRSEIEDNLKKLLVPDKGHESVGTIISFEWWAYEESIRNGNLGLIPEPLKNEIQQTYVYLRLYENIKKSLRRITDMAMTLGGRTSELNRYRENIRVEREKLRPIVQQSMENLLTALDE